MLIFSTPPIFQSGGEFDLRPGSIRKDEYLFYDATGVIICAIRSRYNTYFSNVERTYLINAKYFQGKAYKVLLKAHEESISTLKPWNFVISSYKVAAEVVKRDGSEILPHLTKSIGTGMGIEFGDSGLSLNARSDKSLKVGMDYNVSLGFQKFQLHINNPKKHNYLLFFVDIVIIKDEGSENATGMSSKVTDVSYSFNEEEEKYMPRAEISDIEPSFSKATLRFDNQEMTEEK